MTWRGFCQDCGDDWAEDDDPAVCPECGSLNVIAEIVV